MSRLLVQVKALRAEGMSAYHHRLEQSDRRTVLIGKQSQAKG